jgi:plasmid maintenance system antidote protein VapI
MNHPLSDWIESHMSRAAFADLVKVKKSHLSLILQGKRGMSLDVAARIEAATSGEFTASRLLKEQKSLMSAAQ